MSKHLQARLDRLEAMLTPERELAPVFVRSVPVHPDDPPPTQADLRESYSDPGKAYWIAPDFRVRLRCPMGTSQDCQEALDELRAECRVRRQPVRVEPEEDERHPPKPKRKSPANPNRISPQRRRRPR